MQTVLIELPDTAFAALRKSPTEFASEMRLAAAVKWFELGILSQGECGENCRLVTSGFYQCVGTI